MQKYIASRTMHGHPFDCRVHVEKDGRGKWVVARSFIRIGIGQKVISNVNQGGGIADLKPFLEANFGEKKGTIEKKINHLASTLPYKIEELRNTHIMSLGMDVAIDENGKLYLFEVNGAPTTAPLKAEAVMLRTEYYKFILENIITDNLKKENEQFKAKYEIIEQQKNQFEKRYNDIKRAGPGWLPNLFVFWEVR